MNYNIAHKKFKIIELITSSNYAVLKCCQKLFPTSFQIPTPIALGTILFWAEFTRSIDLHNAILFYAKSSLTYVSKFDRILFNCDFFININILFRYAVLRFLTIFDGFQFLRFCRVQRCASPTISPLSSIKYQSLMLLSRQTAVQLRVINPDFPCDIKLLSFR